MALFLSFLPFILIMVLRRFLSTRNTLMISTGLALANLYWQYSTGGIKSLSAIVCVLLVGMTMTAFIRPALVEQRTGIIIYGVLTLFVFGGIALGQPFSLEYARAQAPEAFWSNPIFIQTSLYISLFWGVSFLLLLLLSIPWKNLPLRPSLRSLIMLLIFLTAVGFTTWYPMKVRQDAQRISLMIIE